MVMAIKTTVLLNKNLIFMAIFHLLRYCYLLPEKIYITTSISIFLIIKIIYIAIYCLNMITIAFAILI